MRSAPQANFASRLAERLSTRSQLVDAANNESIGAEEIRAGIRGFASAFRAAGLEIGDRVLIGCGLRPISSIAYLGAMFGGLVPVPVNESAMESLGAALAVVARARAVWTECAMRTRWTEHAGLRELTGRLSAPGRPIGPAHRGESDLAVLMATSGSTGKPKLVTVTHGNLAANTEAIIRSQAIGVDERAMLILPLSYCFGASILHTHLYCGGAVVFDSRFMFPDKVVHAIADYRCTTFAGVPSVYNILLRRSNIRRIPLPSLRRLLQAGGALSAERILELRMAVPDAQFFAMYGQTEATSRISCLPPDRLGEKLGSVGVPLDNLFVRILGPDGTDVPTGESGELWISGPSVCPGYYEDPDETRRKYHDGWLATGDIVSRDADGFLWITGRKSEFVKMRGVRVSFAEIESRISAVVGVSDCAAMVTAHPEAGEAIAIYVVVDGNPEEVCASIRRSIPTEWICDSFRLVRELPRNAHGKLVRPLLADVEFVAHPAKTADIARTALPKHLDPSPVTRL